MNNLRAMIEGNPENSNTENSENSNTTESNG